MHVNPYAEPAPAPPYPEPTDPIPADDAAAQLGITRRTLNRYASEGRIAVVRHGRRSFVTRAAIADYWSRLHRDADRRRAAAEKRGRR